MKTRDKAISIFVAACLGYVAVSMTAYRFRNPKLTDTELMLNTWEALRWK